MLMFDMQFFFLHFKNLQFFYISSNHVIVYYCSCVFQKSICNCFLVRTIVKNTKSQVTDEKERGNCTRSNFRRRASRPNFALGGNSSRSYSDRLICFSPHLPLLGVWIISGTTIRKFPMSRKRARISQFHSVEARGSRFENKKRILRGRTRFLRTSSQMKKKFTTQGPKFYCDGNQLIGRRSVIRNSRVFLALIVVKTE